MDLSQGIDREIDSRPFGIVGCITPCGIPYISTRGGPLCGLEALSLQGLPLDRLLLTHETCRDLQDLAGNAMSSTVVGSAILSILIVAYQALENNSACSSSPESIDAISDLTPRHDLTLVVKPLTSPRITVSRVSELLAEAAKSIRLCICEGLSAVKRKGILKCALCEHTACSACGGNPTHEYRTIPCSDLNVRGSPLSFAEELKQLLPMCLVLSCPPHDAYDSLQADANILSDESTWQLFLNVVKEAFGNQLRFSGIKRTEVWTVTYEGDLSSLSLTIGTKDNIEWRFYAKPHRSEPALSLVREIFSRPIARMRPKIRSLLEGQWEICAPLSSKTVLNIGGSGARVESFESRCGLQKSEFLHSTVWSHVTVRGSDEAVENLDVDVRGEYALLQNCGSASGSLHRRVAVDCEPLYLFLDPQKLGPPEFDTYVIASTHERIVGDKPRQAIIELDHKWRASKLDGKSTLVKCYYKNWFKCPKMALEAFEPSKSIKCQSLDPSASLDLDSYPCNAANVTLLEISAPTEVLKLPCRVGPWKAIDLTESITCLRDFSWILQKASLFTGFENWNFVACDSATGKTICSTCAPQKPRMIWKADLAGHMKPVEDPLEASIYERQVKARPAPFMGFTRVDEQGLSQLIISINIKTLLHQAYDKLEPNTNVSFSWRLLPKSPDLREYDFGKFGLKRNDDHQCQQPPNFKGLELRSEQRRSLTWMMSCEEENAPLFEEEEVEEALLPFLMWRAEARANIKKTVRGGILADEVGYGKTALILGLIDSQFARDLSRSRDLAIHGTIPLKATLIIATNTIISQWQSEIEKFLQNTYKVLIISTAPQLRKLTIAKFQEADIILASSSLFAGSAYYRAVEQFAGGSAPLDAINKGGRIFDHWLFDALESTSEHVDILCNQGPKALIKAIRAKRDTTNSERNDNTFIQSKRLRGKSLAKASETPTPGSNGEARKRKFDAVDNNQNDRNEMKWNDERDYRISAMHKSWDTLGNVLFHMFCYNRLVIDEFTYVEPKKATAFWTLKARSKWALSGTPPLNDFAGIKDIASFLGIQLGSDDLNDSPGRDRCRDRSGN